VLRLEGTYTGQATSDETPSHFAALLRIGYVFTREIMRN